MGVNKKTIRKKIAKWSAYLGVECPKVRIYANPYIIRGEYHDGLIQIYSNGMDRETIKHEFLHHLLYLKHSQCTDQENLVRKLVARSWKNIKQEYYEGETF